VKENKNKQVYSAPCMPISMHVMADEDFSHQPARGVSADSDLAAEISNLINI